MWIANQLIRVAIPRHDEEFVGIGEPLGNGGDDVIAFITGKVDGLHTRSREHLFDDVHLRIQNVRLLLSLGLVLGSPLVSKRLLLAVEYDDDSVRVVVLDQDREHGAKTKHGIRYLSMHGGHRVWQGKKRPVSQRIAIEGHQFHGVGTVSPFITDSATSRIVVRLDIASF